MHTTERAPSTRLHASIAAALLLAATFAARAGETLSLVNYKVPNALPGQFNPTQVIPSLTGTAYSGQLTGLQVTATACNWQNSAYTTSTPCDHIVWPKAGDLAIIIWEPSPSIKQAPTIKLQVGGATKYKPPVGPDQNFPWIQGSSIQATHPGTCGGINGCAGQNPPPPSAACYPQNPGGDSNYTNQTYTSGSGGWVDAVPMTETTQVMTAWLPETNGNNNAPWPSNAGPVLFCSIDIQFTGVTAETIPPCLQPTNRDDTNCDDPCKCAPSFNPGACSLPVDAVHAVEIRFENRSGRPPNEVKLLPYSCAKSFATAKNPGVLYLDNKCTQVLWRDGLFSAKGPTNIPFNGCGHGPPNYQQSCATVFNGAGPTVPMRTMALTDLHPNQDGTYSLWTNHFPNAIWYIGLPQKIGSGWTTVPEVPFFVPWQGDAAHGDTIEVAGLQCLWQGYDSATNTHYFAPASPAVAKGGFPWPVEPYGDCEADNHCSTTSNGVDWQQVEITLDGNAADVADITYIDFANVPLRLESYSQYPTHPLQSTGFFPVTDASLQYHPDFRALIPVMKQRFPDNLWLTCNGGSQVSVLQAAGPNQVDGACSNSPFIPSFYPAHSTGGNCGSTGTISDFRAVFDKALEHQALGYAWPGNEGANGCAWIRDWLGAPLAPNSPFDYDFVLQMTKVVAPDNSSTTYTATLKGKVRVGNGYTSDPLTIVLGTDTYFADPNKAHILDLTRAIFFAATPGDLPLTLQTPQGCIQNLSTVSLRGPKEAQAGTNSRLSSAWLTLMQQYSESIQSDPASWFGPDADPNVIPLIGRVMGDAYAGFALGFIASEKANPIIPAAGLSPWPNYNSTYPTHTGSSSLCHYDESNGMPFWKTPSGSWWGGGGLFKANSVSGSQYWSPECASRIFREQYNDIAPPGSNGLPLSNEWGATIYEVIQAGYTHAYSDRMSGYNAGIAAYRYNPNPPFVDVNTLKVTIWSGISATSSLLRSDISGDGTVDGYDLNHLLAEWGSCTQVPGGCQSDFDGNGVVDSKDLAELLASWSSVP